MSTTPSSFDKYDLRQTILDYPKELKLGQQFAAGIALEKKEYSNLIICGMGGSALPGDMLADFLEHNEPSFKLPIYISRTYALPKQASSSSLVFISSYSGSTEETVACFHEALKIKAAVVAFSEGGEIEKMAKDKKIPHVKYKIKIPNIQPRYVATYAFMSMHEILTKVGLASKIKKIPSIQSRDWEIYGEELAQKCQGKVPVVYASPAYQLLAKFWKIKINENSKSPAFWNYFPELNHNEMVGFSHPTAEFFVIMLQDKEDLPSIKKRMLLTSKLYNENGVGTEIVALKGTTYLEKFLGGLALGDWVSYYLAYAYGIDPTPVDMVEKFKKRLK